ncbi:Transketolase, thiamine diphosphate binding domain-containing protein [Lipomyces orientalis]|uniref:Transketolase, thiamine diphosphate binding domain-containing protein n=1 Tax=Lipomyces orientalis TaxID=1233043 RepID=A0ACC3TDT9_9ASCO
MGMAAIGFCLWKYMMKYSPNDPSFFNRDRFVLSNGYTYLFQYWFHHFVGYKHMIMEKLKPCHSRGWESFCPGPDVPRSSIPISKLPLVLSARASPTQ